MWQTNGLDLHIIPYGCISTGNMMGMIQVVQDAETVAKVTRKRYMVMCLTMGVVCVQIQLKQGGTLSALKEEPLHDWLKKQNPTYVGRPPEHNLSHQLVDLIFGV